MPLPAEDKPNMVDLDEAIVKLKKIAPEGGLFLDFGAGQQRQEGFIGIDLFPSDDQTMAGNIWSEITINDHRGLLPGEPNAGTLADNSVSMIYSSHFMEHVDKYDWPNMWQDIYRICKPGAQVVTIFPYGNSTGAHQDPTHRQCLFIESFLYLDRDWREAVNMDHGYLADVNFKLTVAPWFVWDEDFAGASDQAREYHMKHTFNAVRECVVFMECIKKEEEAK